MSRRMAAAEDPSSGTPLLPLVVDGRAVRARCFAMASSDTLVFHLARSRPMPRRNAVSGPIVLPRAATLRSGTGAAVRLSVSTAEVRVDVPVIGSFVVSVGP